jgi:hypothetical protein
MHIMASAVTGFELCVAIHRDRSGRGVSAGVVNLRVRSSMIERVQLEAKDRHWSDEAVLRTVAMGLACRSAR